LATSQRGLPSQGAIIEPEASSKNRMRVTLGFSGGAFCARLCSVKTNSTQPSSKRIAPRAKGLSGNNIGEIYSAARV